MIGLEKACAERMPPPVWQRVLAGDLGIPVLLALAVVLLHTLTNGRYGDQLMACPPPSAG